MNINKGKDHLIKILKKKGLYTKYMRLLQAGKITEAAKITEGILDEQRAEFDQVMKDDDDRP